MTDERRGDAIEEIMLGLKPQLTPEQERVVEQTAAEKAQVRKLYLQGQMATPQFREWLMDLLLMVGTFAPPFANSPGGFPDPMATMFAMGRKSVGDELWMMFDDASPDMASLMRRERTERKPKQ